MPQLPKSFIPDEDPTVSNTSKPLPPSLQVGPSLTGLPKSFTPEGEIDVPDVTSARDAFGRFLIEALPGLAAQGVTMAFPQAGLPLRIALSGLGGAVGSGVKQGIKSTWDAPAEADPKVANVPESAIPESAKDVMVDAATQMGGEIVGTGIMGVLGKLFGRAVDPKQLYQSAMHASTAKSAGDVDRMIDAGLRYKIPVNEEGADAAHQAWRGLGSQVQGEISAGAAAGDVIRPSAATVSLNELRTQWSETPEFLKKLDAQERKFLRQHVDRQLVNNQYQSLIQAGRTPDQADNIMARRLRNLRWLRQNASDIPVDRAQDIKQQIYEQVRMTNQKAWAEGAHPGISEQAQKQIARGLKEELENLYPQIKSLNADTGAMIELDRALQRFAIREGNKRITSFFIPAAMGGAFGAAMGGAEAGAASGLGVLAAGLTRAAIEDPGVKSRLAIALYRASKNPIGKAAKYAGKNLTGAGYRGGIAIAADSMTDYMKNQPEEEE